MTGKKRTRSGHVKSPAVVEQPPPMDTDATMTEPPPPPCTQPQPPSSNSTATRTPVEQSNSMQNTRNKKQKIDQNPSTAAAHLPKPQPPYHPPKDCPKLQRLPHNAVLTKRPLLHPALPSPASSSPQTLYITASTPFIPTLKRIRRHLSSAQARVAQSLASQARGRKRGFAEANGRLEARDVERGIVQGAQGGRVVGNEVLLKATGRAILRALEIGVRMQGEGEYRVRVEIGNVSAIDDIEVRRNTGEGEEEDVEDVPESRVRMLSSVTVGIGMK